MSEDFFRKICTSHFIVRVRKGLLKVLRVRGSWRPNRNCNILTPTLMTVSIVSFSFSRAAQPEAQGPSSLLDDGFLYCILSATSLDPNSTGPQGPPPPGFLYYILSSNSSNFQLYWGPWGPLSAWHGFPYYVSSNSNCLTSCLDWVI